jgi:hypothetical protein
MQAPVRFATLVKPNETAQVRSSALVPGTCDVLGPLIVFSTALAVAALRFSPAQLNVSGSVPLEMPLV